VYFHGGRDVVYAFGGLPLESAADRLYVPLVRRGFHGTTGVSVVNLAGSEAAVTLTVTGGGGELGSTCAGKRFVQGPVTLPSGTGALFYQGPGKIPLTGESPLPDGCVGSAVIEAVGGGVVAVVNDAGGTGYPPDTSAAYIAFRHENGQREVALSLIRREHTHSKLTTGIQVMNLAEQSAEVSLRVWLSDGYESLPPATATLDPLGSHTFYPPDLTIVPPGQYGAGKLESTQPIVAIVNDASLNGRMDAAIYSGHAQVVPAPHPSSAPGRAR
jgi:hypothetical protein